MRIRPSSPAIVALFQRLLPETGGDARTMFGCPCGFIGGNMFMGIFQDQLFVRLAEADRTTLLGREGAALFDPMGGRPMREYVTVPTEWLEGDRDEDLRAWCARAAGYAKRLPPKGKALPVKRKTSAAPPPAGARVRPAPKKTRSR